ncbi:MAG: type II toxin-antitoxin system VapC family toxin [Nocardioides sp.]
MIEASAVVDALVDDPANPELLAFVADSQLHAPSLIDYEVASALRGHVHGGKLAVPQLDDAIEDFAGLRIERYPLANMIHHVLGLRDNFTVYAAAYIVLAQALEVPLITADAKLTEARRVGVDVRVLRPSS